MTEQASLFGEPERAPTLGDLRAAPGLSSNGWGMLLAVRRRLDDAERARAIGSDAQMAQEAGIAPHGQLTSKTQRWKAAEALTELEDAGYVERDGGRWVIHEEKVRADAPAGA